MAAKPSFELRLRKQGLLRAYNAPRILLVDEVRILCSTKYIWPTICGYPKFIPAFLCKELIAADVNRNGASGGS